MGDDAHTPGTLLGRVNATIRTSSTLFQLGETIFAGVVGKLYGLRVALWIGLGGAVLAFLSIWFSPLRTMRDVPTGPFGPAVAGEEVPLSE